MSLPVNNTSSTTLMTSVNTTVTWSTTEINIWGDQGTGHQIFEIVYLTILCVLGTLGNLIVVFSIALEKRVHSHGNIFIINLAAADLIVTGFVVPTVIANVIERGNAFPGSNSPMCNVIGYAVTLSCTCSLCNLTFIALNRFWAVVKPASYTSVFSNKRIYVMMGVAWVWSALLVLPTQLGWGGIKYDRKIMVCSWDDEIAISYTIFITICAVFIPLCIIAACYWKLFNTVQASGRWVRSLSVGSGLSSNNAQHRRSMRKERALLRTLATTVLFFCVCWLPFGFTVMIDPTNINKYAKKIFGWLALTNSCVNFIIYGVLNPVFRRGYKNLFIFIFFRKRVKRINSTAMHGSFSEQGRNTTRKSSRQDATNGRFNENNRFHGSKGSPVIDSRADTYAVLPQETVTSNLSTPRLHVNVVSENGGGKHPMTEAEVIQSSDNNNINSGGRKRSYSSTISNRKKSLLKPFKHASLLRGSRPPRSATVDEEQDKITRSKRNSLMLLQISVGDNWSDEDSNQINSPADISSEDGDKESSNSTLINQDDELLSPPEDAREKNFNINNNSCVEKECGEESVQLPRSWTPPHTLYLSRMQHRSRSVDYNMSQVKPHKTCFNNSLRRKTITRSKTRDEILSMRQNCFIKDLQTPVDILSLKKVLQRSNDNNKNNLYSTTDVELTVRI